MKKIAALLCAVLAVLCLSTEAFGAPKGAVLIDMKNGRVFFELNKDEKLPMASTTKIMTALLTLEEVGLDEYFTVDSGAIKVEGSSMGLTEGDKVTLRALAAGMLLASGNDAANAAAVKIAGSVENFVQLMNERAQDMGLGNTSFETPSGLDGENHYSTAYEMALLAKAALENPDFADICGAKSLQTEYGNLPYSRWLTNHNKLLKTLEGAIGVKTGFTKKAGRCLVSAAEREGVALICVTLCCPDDWNYHTALYEEYFAKLEGVPLESLAEGICVPVCGGEEKEAKVSAEAVSAALFEGEAERIEVVISKEPFVFAPVEKGDILGKVLFYLDGELLAEAPLLAESSIGAAEQEKNFWQKIKETF